MNKKYSISFVIPVYRSEKTIESVVTSISKIDLFDWEVVLVNDNSPDAVDSVIKKMIKRYSDRIVYIQLVKNGGQHAAIITGFNYTTKMFVATIDDDGQNPPIEVIKLIEKLTKDNLDLVYGYPRQMHQNFFRGCISSFNNIVSKYTIGNKNGIMVSNVRLMRDYIAKGMAQTSSQYNYIEGLAFLLTDRIDSIFIEHKERAEGKSCYSFSKLVKLWSYQVIGYSNIVLKIISIISLIISVLAFLIGVIYFFVTFENSNRPTGWLSTYLTITVLFSFMFLVISILSEYIGRIYSKMNQSGVKIIRRIHA